MRMRSTTHSRSVHLMTAVAGLSIIAGCGNFPLPFAPPQLPATVKHVVDERASFGAQGHVLSEVLAGTTMDSLDGIEGCRGAYVRLSPMLEIFMVLVADRENQEMTGYALQLDGYGLLPLLFVERGPYAVIDENQVEWTVNQLLISDRTTGELVVDETYMDGSTNATPMTYHMLMTLDGDHLKYLLGFSEPDPAHDAESILLRRLECLP